MQDHKKKSLARIVITIHRLKESAFKVRKAYGKPRTSYTVGGKGERFKNDFGEV